MENKNRQNRGFALEILSDFKRQNNRLVLINIILSIALIIAIIF